MSVKKILRGMYECPIMDCMKTYTEEDFKRWGRKGGKARAKALTPEQRQEISRKAGSTKRRALRASKPK